MATFDWNDGIFGLGLASLWGWFLRHVLDKKAHGVEIPEGDDKPVTLALCNQRFMEHEKAAARQEATQRRIEQKLDELIGAVARLEVRSERSQGS